MLQLHLIHAIDLSPDDPQIKAVIETQRLHMMAPTKEHLAMKRKEERIKAKVKNTTTSDTTTTKKEKPPNMLSSTVSTKSMQYDKVCDTITRDIKQ